MFDALVCDSVHLGRLNAMHRVRLMRPKAGHGAEGLALPAQDVPLSALGGAMQEGEKLASGPCGE
jgi:hypothetical protein